VAPSDSGRWAGSYEKFVLVVMPAAWPVPQFGNRVIENQKPQTQLPLMAMGFQGESSWLKVGVKMFSSILFLHICGGVAGLLSGAVAMIFRKGSRRHGMAGKMFVISMLALGASGAWMALMKHQPTNVAGGTLTCYLVATAWSTARHRDGETNWFDWGAVMVPLAVAAAFIFYGFKTRLPGDPPAAVYFVTAFINLLFAAGDIRMLVAHGLSGTKRLARHLLRMCFALFVASGSLFLARPHLFPVFMRKTGLLLILGYLPLLLMVFWLARVRFASAYKRKRSVAVVPATLSATGSLRRAL
jgi:uncharacterized membrane protein